MNYSEQLKDPRWQRKRLEIMQRDNFKCTQCEDGKSTLNVHHRYYVAHRFCWEYPDFCLITLCENCHKSEGDKYEERRGSGASVFDDWEAAADYFGESRLVGMFVEEVELNNP